MEKNKHAVTVCEGIPEEDRTKLTTKRKQQIGILVNDVMGLHCQVVVIMETRRLKIVVITGIMTVTAILVATRKTMAEEKNPTANAMTMTVANAILDATQRTLVEERSVIINTTMIQIPVLMKNQ